MVLTMTRGDFPHATTAEFRTASGWEFPTKLPLLSIAVHRFDVISFEIENGHQVAFKNVRDIACTSQLGLSPPSNKR